MVAKLISQGAEAKIFLTKNKSSKFIIKDRIKKSYRIPELDNKIRISRTKSEAKLLMKASKVIASPELFFVPDFLKIKMLFINGKKLSDHLNGFPLKKQKQIAKLIGKNIKKLHEANIIHGDLTTSNMILVEDNSDNINIKGKKTLLVKSRKVKNSDKVGSGATNKSMNLYFIDFGLGFISHKHEDRAVDLYLLKEAFEAKHFKTWKTLYGEAIKEYKKLKTSKIIFERLKSVEKRRRYRH